MPAKKVESSKKAAPKAEKVTIKENVAVKKADGLTITVYSLKGVEAGTMALPKEVFDKKVNKELLAQATRVYLTNQRTLSGSTKSRGEVNLTKAKWFRQKGTGRARHGAQSAPIFVGGGVAFGPKPRKVILELPKKMKRAALLMALSAKLGDQGVLGVEGLDKSTGKTKEMNAFIGKIGEITKSKSTLIVTGEKMDNVVRSVRNIPGMSVLPAAQLNAFEVLKHQSLLLTKDAVAKLGESVKGKGISDKTEESKV